MKLEEIYPLILQICTGSASASDQQKLRDAYGEGHFVLASSNGIAINDSNNNGTIISGDVNFIVHCYNSQLANLLSGVSAPTIGDPSREPQLELPGDIVPINSPFYVNRKCDIEATKVITKTTNFTLSILGSSQVGKTSLLHRLIYKYKNFNNNRSVIINLKHINFNNNIFYKEIYDDIVHQLGIENRFNVFLTQFEGNVKYTFSRCIEEDVLNIGCPLVLAIDGMERLFNSELGKDFLGLLRSWHEKRGYQEVWKKLSMILVTSTAPWRFITHTHSPFNVSYKIYINDFDFSHACVLNNLHSECLSEAGVNRLTSLVGGHPYLVRWALYQVSAGACNEQTLFDNAFEIDGPFRNQFEDLNHLCLLIRQTPDLKDGLRSILRHQSETGLRRIVQRRSPDLLVVDRLKGLGLIRTDQGINSVRCKLYEVHFRRCLDVR